MQNWDIYFVKPVRLYFWDLEDSKTKKETRNLGLGKVLTRSYKMSIM